MGRPPCLPIPLPKCLGTSVMEHGDYLGNSSLLVLSESSGAGDTATLAARCTPSAVQHSLERAPHRLSSNSRWCMHVAGGYWWEKEAHFTLLQALYTADFEELPLKYDICEVLSKLGGSDPDTSSTVRITGLLCL